VPPGTPGTAVAGRYARRHRGAKAAEPSVCHAPLVDAPLIPTVLARNVRETWGAQGERWLAALPASIADVAGQWDLTVGAAFAMSFHWVAAVTRSDGTPAVLKLGPTGPGHLAHEAAALDAFDGRGAVRLLAYDGACGALLLERAEPGSMARYLVPKHDGEATAAAVAVLRRLHRRPPPHCSLPQLEDEAECFAAHQRAYPGDDPVPRRLVERAGRLFDELCATAPTRVLLHGDLHHDNLLSATREPWLAIDPHGVVGDPGYDVGALVYNPDPDRRDDRLLSLVPARIEQLADGLRTPVERVVSWAFVKAVLSQVWSAEDGGTPSRRTRDVSMLLASQLP